MLCSDCKKKGLIKFMDAINPHWESTVYKCENCGLMKDEGGNTITDYPKSSDKGEK